MDGASRNFVWLTAGLLAVELILLCFVPLPLLDPDEPLFACVARQMWETGDYITPEFKGEAFYDRPVLFYWLLAMSVACLGDHDLTYRLPNLLLGLGTVLVTGLMARHLFGSAVAAASCFIMTTLVGGAVLRLAIGHDGALVFFTTTTIYFGLRWAQSCSTQGRSREWTYAGLMGMGIGLGILSKGLLGLGLPAIGIGALVFMMQLKVRARSLAAAIALGLLLGSSWYLMMHLKHPDYLRYYLWERHVLGFFTTSQRHGGRPIWIYLPVLLIGGAPWLLLFLDRGHVAVAPDAAASRTEQQASKAIFLWGAVTTLIFLVAGSRNPTYLLPVVPPAAILMGKRLIAWWGGATSERLQRCLQHLPTITLLGVFVGTAGAGLQFERWPAIAIGLMGAAIVTLYGLVRGTGSPVASPRKIVLMQSTFSLAATFLTVFFVIPEIAQERSACSTIHAIRESVDADVPVLWFNHLPPSALYHGGGMDLQRVYYDEVPQQAEEPLVFVTRESRLEEVRTFPLLRDATHIDLGGKYHIFLCQPSQLARQPLLDLEGSKH